MQHEVYLLKLVNMVGNEGIDTPRSEGWSAGPNGTQLWGRFGAAGLLLVAEGHVLMQHRAVWTAQGGTWALPGGAREAMETAFEAATREAQEETGIGREQVFYRDEIVTAGPFDADPDRPELAGGWTYTTVIATAAQKLRTQANEESEALEWVSIDEVAELDLLPAFGQAWPMLRANIIHLR